MKIEFYNPDNLKIPTKLQLLVDNTYIIEYERDYDVTSQEHVAYTFKMKLKNNVKIDTIQEIMAKIGSILIEQSYTGEYELNIHDFEIKKIDNNECIYKLIFFKS